MRFRLRAGGIADEWPNGLDGPRTTAPQWAREVLRVKWPSG